MTQVHPGSTDLSPFAKLVKDWCGLVIDPENDMLASAIKHRMACQHIACHTEYHNVLLTHDDEIHRLVDLLTVNETYFFREKEHYDVFANRLFPELLEKKKSGTGRIKILSAGCSSGEEPYSIAMTLAEKYGPDILNSVSIVGCDINQNVLEKARLGIYGNHSFRGVDGSMQGKYFTPINKQQYRIADYIKNAVVFQPVNFLGETYPELLGDIDIIFYRNVSIYFKADIQALIFKKLSGILNENGYIFTSSTETFLHDIGILFLTEYDEVFLYRKKIEIQVDDRRRFKKTTPPSVASVGILPKKYPELKKPIPRQPARGQIQPAGNAHREKTANQELFDKALYSAMDKKYGEALNQIDLLLENNPSLIKAHTLKASILMNLDRLAEAKHISENTLKMDEWNLECFLILGMIAKIECNYEDTLKQFKTAIYTQPNCWLAHFYLAETYNSTGVPDEACREYSIAMKLMEKNGLVDNGLTYFPISFSVDQLIHLCKHNIARLENPLTA